ncbi:hypothetical protein MOQ72_38640 [Saccharopolyspora sp. K220]|uniref:hypothetical protein n=1 Tax=Saccharopolyspora soli TaxID=2926618 RepID=UPI001F58C469|nr:hypothetical protein [Saccharopolyspora soli]MCI2423354.1 hypothetical protein [Saccharopolyspora soli]
MISTQRWLRAYAELALRIDRRVTQSGGGLFLDYRGPEPWREQTAAEEPPPIERLLDDAEQLRADLPQLFAPPRSAFLDAQLQALTTTAHRLAGAEFSLAEHTRRCMGLDVAPLPEELFEQAHAELDRALPAGPGTLADRLHSWQNHHSLPDVDRLPDLVLAAVAETRARTAATIIELPEEQVDCQLVSEVAFLGAGYHAGGTRSIVFINRDLPFNLADLLDVVAHEGHPGHIAEQLLKEIHLVDGNGCTEQQVRFLLSPQFTISEALGMHAQALLFPDDEAQRWLTDNVLGPCGIRPDSSDFAAIHHARKMLFGVWGNATFLTSEGRSEAAVADYLRRWGLFAEHELGPVLGHVTAQGGNPYLFGYYQGWDLLSTCLTGPDRHRQARRLLTEQTLPTDFTPTDSSA